MPELYPYSKIQWSLSHPTGLGMCIPAVWSTLGRTDLAKNCAQALEVGMGLFGQGILGFWVPITWSSKDKKVSRWGTSLWPKGKGIARGAKERIY